jgi:hypothetical protein
MKTAQAFHLVLGFARLARDDAIDTVGALPFRFTPIYQYRLWGGRRLAAWLKTPLPQDGPIGEA